MTPLQVAPTCSVYYLGQNCKEEKTGFMISCAAAGCVYVCVCTVQESIQASAGYFLIFFVCVPVCSSPFQICTFITNFIFGLHFHLSPRAVFHNARLTKSKLNGITLNKKVQHAQG